MIQKPAEERNGRQGRNEKQGGASSGVQGAIQLIIYTRPGCHLCDEMKATVHRVAHASPDPIAIEEIDISSDADLERLYGQEIPVLFVRGRKAAKYRISDGELQRILGAR